MAGGPDGPVVGRVSIRVTPNVQNFREKVEQQLSGLRDAEVDIAPDVSGFREQVNAATRGLRAQVNTDLDSSGLRRQAQTAAAAASGQDVEFDAELDALGLRQEARLAANRASGHEIKFTPDWDTRLGKHLIMPESAELPGLKADLAALGSQVKNITLKPFVRSTGEARAAFKPLTGTARTFHRALQAIGLTTRRATPELEQFDRVMRRTTRGYKINRAMLRWFSDVRTLTDRGIGQPFVNGLGRLNKAAKNTATSIREINQAAGLDNNQLRQTTREQVEWLEREIDALHKLGVERKKINRKGKNNKQRRIEIRDLKEAAQGLRDMGPIELRDNLPAFTERVRKMQEQIGSTEEFTRFQDGIDRSNHALRRLRQGMKMDRLVGSFDTNKLRSQIEYIGGAFGNLRRRMRGMSQDIQLTGLTGIRRKFSGLRGGIERTTESSRGMGKTLRNAFSKTASAGIKTASSAIKGVGAAAKGAGKAVKSMGKAISSGGGKRRKILGLSTMAWKVGAIASVLAPAISVVSGLAASLPALGSAAVAALGVTALGFEGIKDAASAMEPAVGRAQDALSDMFRTRMTPQFEQLGGVLDSVRGELVGVGEGLTSISQGFVDAVSSEEGVGMIEEFLGNTGQMFKQIKPFAEDFTTGLLDMASAGSETFDTLGNGLNRFGRSFKENVAELTESGEMQRAIENTYSVIGNLGTNLGRVLRVGIESFDDDMRDSINHLTDGIGDAVVGLTPVLASLSEGVFDVFGTVGTELGEIGTAIAPSFDTVMEELSRGGSDLVSGIGDLAVELGPAVGELAAAVAPVAGDLLSGLGQDLENASNTLDEHAPDLEENLGRIGDAFADLTGNAVPEGEDVGTLEKIFGAPLVSESDAQLVEDLSDSMATFMENLAEDAPAFAEDVKSVAGSIDNFVDRAKNKWNDFFGGTSLNWGPPDLKMGSAEGGSPSLTEIGLPDFSSEDLNIPDISTELDGMREDINTFVTDTQTQFSNWASTIGTTVNTAMTTLVTTVQTRLVTIATSVSTFFATLAQAVVTGMSQISTYVSTMMQQIALSTITGLQLILNQVTVFFTVLAAQVVQRMTTLVTLVQQSMMLITQTVVTHLTMLQQQVVMVMQLITVTVTNSLVQMQTAIATMVPQLVVSFITPLLMLPPQVTMIFTQVTMAMTVALTAAIGIVTGLASSFVSAIRGRLNALIGVVSGIFSEVVSTISGVFGGAVGLVAGIAASAVAAVSGALSSLPGIAAGIFSLMVSGIMGIVSELASQLPASFGEMISVAVGIIAILPSRARGALSGIGGVLVSSGVALVRGFIKGIRSMIGAVASAASEVVSAARNFFPFSPAKEGPFSGRGYTLYSGIALVQDFAKGMESQVATVRKAASDVAGAAQREFGGLTVNPSGFMEGFHRDNILQETLEANAKKINDFREREADSAERLNERIAKINESDADQARKEERIAAARESAAERSAEAKERLHESLEAPDYSRIDRSFESYWVQGMRDALTQGVQNIASDMDLAGQTRNMALAAVQEGRRVFGSHPIFNQVEASVQAEHFADVLQKVIEESGIAEIPVDFAVSNLDQLKRDLGMGDGLVSRALDAVTTTDPTDTDSAWAKENNVTEVHYHVEDMQEAIRLENQRQRKEMMKMK